MNKGGVVLILGSGPNAVQAADWPRAWFDRVVVINNAWRVRPDWDDLVFPEDFPVDRRPGEIATVQHLIEADAFVPAQNRFGGFVFAGATMAYTAAYWALDALQPDVLAFMGCDMVYPKTGATHFYGTGTADPLRPDVSLRDLGAKSARLALIAALQACACVNLSQDTSSLVFERATASGLRDIAGPHAPNIADLRAREEALGYATPSGHHAEFADKINVAVLDALDQEWRERFSKSQTA
ncbi:hypothetical protein [Sulfitobacter sp. JB4-11]|uniref:hypothetical protein n=1 Tax=Sulfitobacter rhodophyticola TaxID=3238304 RepID=UPI0035131F35